MRTRSSLRSAGGFLGLCVSAVLVSLALVASTHAQTFRGTLVGTVRDASGAVVAGARVIVRNLGTGLERETRTDAEGNYSIPELPLGRYNVTVAKEGFQTAVAIGAALSVAGETRVEVTLRPGAVAERVEVKAEVPLLETGANVLGGSVESRAIAALPVNGRDYIKLIFLVPGVAGSPDQATDSPGSFGLFSANGARGRANNYLLDGTDMNDGYRNLPAINQAGVFGTPATLLPVEAVAEVAVLSNFEPEYGRNAGAVVNIVTKSGTNDWHGSLFEYWRNDVLDARNYFNPSPIPQTALRNNQFGVSLGGPWRRDRTFLFLDYEAQRERVGLASVARVPCPAEIIAASPAAPATINPVITQLLGRKPWPTPNPLFCFPFRALFDPNPNIAVTTRARNRVDSFIAKLDHNLNPQNLFTGRYYFGDSDQSFPLALLAGNILPGFNTVTPTRVQLVSLSWVRVLSANRVNELRVGYNRFAETFFPEDRSFAPSSIGLNTGVDPRDTGLPFIRLTGFAPIGSNLSLPRGRVDTNWHGIENFSWKSGRHQWKFGYEFRRTFINGFFDAGYRGRLDFRYGDLQTSLQNFLLGVPSGGRQARGISDRDTFQNSHAAYVQDSFRWTPRLTLNFGARWDYYGVLDEKRGLLSNFDPTNGLRMVGSATLLRLYEPDWNNFAPRVSLAWDPWGKGKRVIRAGWGLFYDVFSQDFFVGQLPFNSLNPGPAYNPLGPAAVLFASGVNRDAAGNALPLGSMTPIFPSTGGASVFRDSDVFAVDRNLRTPYIQNYNLNFQQEITRYAMVQVGYVGSQGRKLFRYRDINQPVNPAVSTARPFDNGPFAPSGRPFVYVNYLETSASSSYNALQASVRVRGLRGLDSTLNYTWSHSIDTASDGQDYVANASQPDDSHRPQLDRASSNFDLRHRWVWHFIYQLPNWRGRWAKLTDNWQISGALTAQSGHPFHLVLFDDYNGTGEFFPRPDLVGDPFAGRSIPGRFLNLTAFRAPCTLGNRDIDGDGITDTNDGTAAFCDPATFHFGSLGRNALRGPGYSNFDLAVSKDLPVTERVTFQVRAEAYNLFNHPNFSSPLLPGFSVDAGANGIDPATGRGIGFLPLITTADVGIGNPFLGGGGPRNFQIVLRLTF